MPDRLYRLMEHHQKLDRLLAAAQGRKTGDPFEILRLKKLKLMVRSRLAHAMQRPLLIA